MKKYRFAAVLMAAAVLVGTITAYAQDAPDVYIFPDTPDVYIFDEGSSGGSTETESEMPGEQIIFSEDEALVDLSGLEELEPYKKAYISLLLSFMSLIDAGTEPEADSPDALFTGTKRRVAVCDVYGDEIPEVLFVTRDPEEPEKEDLYLYIVTYKDGNLVILYRSDWEQLKEADRWYYCLFRCKDDNSLYVYKDVYSDGMLDEVYSYINFEMEPQEILCYEKIDYIANETQKQEFYRFNYAPITEGEYMMLANSLRDNISEVLLINFAGWDYDDHYLGETENQAVTCIEAINALAG